MISQIFSTIKKKHMFVKFYLILRKRLRNFVLKYQIDNKYFLFVVVKFDLFLRKLGILDSFKKSGLINVNGYKIYFGKEDFGIADTLITNNDYELETRGVIGRLLNADSIFFDLGANIGLHSIFASQFINGSGKIYSFEPTPDTFNFLVKNIDSNNLNGIIVPENLAVTNKKGYSFFSVTNNSECNSIVSDENENNLLIKVPTISIDEYCEMNKIAKVDLIKMDIEGQELNAMKSMIKTVKSNDSIKIIFELHETNLNNNNQDSFTIIEFLHNLGLTYFMLINHNPIYFRKDEDLNFLIKQLKIYNVNILASKYPFK